MPIIPPNSGVTIESARRLLTQNFEAAGIDSAALDAGLLIEYVTGLSRTDQIIAAAQSLSSEDLGPLNALAARRAAGAPIDALTGRRAFWNDEFTVSEHVLTPRPETEGIIEAALKISPAPKSILDMGTGSGAIILSLLGEFAQAKGTATDISPEALEVAKGNAARLGRDCKFILSDWFDTVTGRFDLIVSNPPYITDAAMHRLSPQVIGFDPDLALRGGPDGLAPYRVIAARAANYLRPGGTLIFEIGFDQGPAVEALLNAHSFRQVAITKDLAGHDRIVTGRAPL